ncbi:MAG: hypothetical protein Q4C56_08735 [Peptococcaceae bacterium]|nr:hypothetical protein [Peptococcaceae bacterium]
MEMREIAVLILLGVLLGALVIYYGQRLADRKKRQHISQRAQRGEADAEKLLHREGYAILARQERRPIAMRIDGKRYESFIQADFLAERAGKTYLVEVKTGKQANLHLPNVRRQLFEYQKIFETDGILFIDMNDYDIIEVSFDTIAPRRLPFAAYFWGVVTGTVVTIFVLSYL